MRILLIEDNASLSTSIAEYFATLGYPLDRAGSAEEAVSVLAHTEFELLILDINLPGQNGYQFLHALRARGNRIPVLVLTARAEVDDRVTALDQGADDYLVKPFDFRELAARCRALIRRERGGASNDIQYGNLYFNIASMEARIDGEELPLRPREAQILLIFLRNLDVMLSKDDIANRLYTFDQARTPNAVEQTLTRLRKKLVGASLVIKTVRGLGYLAHVDD